MKEITLVVILLFITLFYIPRLIIPTTSIQKWEKETLKVTFTVTKPGIYFIDSCNKIDWDFSLMDLCRNRFHNNIFSFSEIDTIQKIDSTYNRCFVIYNYSGLIKIYTYKHIQWLLTKEIGMCLGFSENNESGSILQMNIPPGFQWEEELKEKVFLQMLKDKKQVPWQQTDEDDNPVWPSEDTYKYWYLI